MSIYEPTPYNAAICGAPSYFLDATRGIMLNNYEVEISKWAICTDDPGETGENVYPTSIVVNDPPHWQHDETGIHEMPQAIGAAYSQLDPHTEDIGDGIPRFGWLVSFRMFRFQDYGEEETWCEYNHPPLLDAPWVHWQRASGVGASTPIEGFDGFNCVLIAGDTRINRIMEFGRSFFTLLDEACDADKVHAEAVNGVGYWTLAAKKVMLQALLGSGPDFSLHTGCPGPMGEDYEYEGESDWGPYQRRTGIFAPVTDEPEARLYVSALFRGARGDEVTWLGMWYGGIFLGAINLQTWNEETQEWEGAAAFGEETCLLKIMKDVTVLRIDDLEEPE